MWWSEDNPQVPILFFYHVSPGDLTQIISLDGK